MFLGEITTAVSNQATTIYYQNLPQVFSIFLYFGETLGSGLYRHVLVMWDDKHCDYYAYMSCN